MGQKELPNTAFFKLIHKIAPTNFIQTGQAHGQGTALGAGETERTEIQLRVHRVLRLLAWNNGRGLRNPGTANTKAGSCPGSR